MQRRHILEGENLVAKQQALVEKLIEKGHHGLVETANELLGILRESLELSRTLLQRCWRVGILRKFGAKGFRFSCRERIMPFKILWGVDSDQRSGRVRLRNHLLWRRPCQP